MLISLFTKKSKKDPSFLSLKPNKKKNQHWLNSVWEKLSLKTKLNLKRKSNFWRNKQSKKNQNQKFKKNLKKLKNREFSLIWILLKFLPSFLRISVKKYQKQMKSFHFRLTYQMMNSLTFYTRFCRFNHLMNLQQSIWNCVTNVSIWNKLLKSQQKKETLWLYHNGQQKDSNKSLKDMAGSFWKTLVKTGNQIFYQLKNQRELGLKIYWNVLSAILSIQMIWITNSIGLSKARKLKMNWS